MLLTRRRDGRRIPSTVQICSAHANPQGLSQFGEIMSSLNKRRLNILFPLIALGAVAAAPAHAALITYSGSGTIAKVSASSTDPWSIGNGTLPMTYSVVLDSGEPDSNENINTASFYAIHSGSFVISGTPAIFQDAPEGGEVITFVDNEFGIGDSFTTRFVASRNGIEQNILIGYFIGNSAFTFNDPLEPAPVYGDQTTLFASSGIGTDSSYRVTIGDGSIQSAVVPEPASAIALAAAACAVLNRRRRH
jgi:hypothetical protein